MANAVFHAAGVRMDKLRVRIEKRVGVPAQIARPASAADSSRYRSAGRIALRSCGGDRRANGLGLPSGQAQRQRKPSAALVGRSKKWRWKVVSTDTPISANQACASQRQEAGTCLA